MAILINKEYPHTAVIRRDYASTTPPYTATSDQLWSGVVDCQVGIAGGTSLRQTVFVSDYTIYSSCIEAEIVDGGIVTATELQTGHIISVTLGEGKTPFGCTIEQFETSNVWEENGVAYGTTIWANRVR